MNSCFLSFCYQILIHTILRSYQISARLLRSKVRGRKRRKSDLESESKSNVNTSKVVVNDASEIEYLQDPVEFGDSNADEIKDDSHNETVKFDHENRAHRFFHTSICLEITF